MSRFVDTNILLRHLLDDHVHHSPSARALLLAIETGHVAAWTTSLVIAEAVFILSNRGYDLPRAEIRDLLLPIVELPGLRVEGKRSYARVFDLYVSQDIDYIDAYHAAQIEARGETELFSFDRHLDRVPSLRRIEYQA